MKKTVLAIAMASLFTFAGAQTTPKKNKSHKTQADPKAQQKMDAASGGSMHSGGKPTDTGKGTSHSGNSSPANANSNNANGNNKGKNANGNTTTGNTANSNNANGNNAASTNTNGPNPTSSNKQQPK